MSTRERSVQPEPNSDSSPTPAPANGPGDDATAELATLRQLMVGPLLRQQAELASQLEELSRRQTELTQRSKDCSEILAASIDRLHDEGRDLNRQLEPEIFSGVQRSFQNEPERMAELMYPILGPAVRKLVASLFQRSQTDTGKPYQVEQLFLIHKETSILLSQAVLDEESARDADLVSGMLEAIRSFVTDAFSLHEFDGMNSINLGDLTVWVEWGPKAVLAVVIRGFPDEGLREHYASILEQIHRQYADQLNAFAGETSAFDALDIATLHQTEATDESGHAKIRSWMSVPRMCLAAALLLMFTLANTVSDNRQWSNMMTRLSAEPGVVVVDAQRNWRKDNLTILVDPLASPVEQIIRRARIDETKTLVNWHAFQSHDIAIAQRRQTQRRLFSVNNRTRQPANSRPLTHTGHE